MTIEANIAARRGAEEMISLMGQQPLRFWEVLIELATAKLPPKPSPVDPLPALTEGEAIYFERTELPYGKFAGQTVGCVDPAYLLFLTEGDVFAKNLRRYVKPKRFAERQGDAE